MIIHRILIFSNPISSAYSQNIEMHGFFNFQQQYLESKLDEPQIIAIILMLGTTYACNHDNQEDSICSQSQIRDGLYMIAIALNGDQICLQWN